MNRQTNERHPEHEDAGSLARRFLAEASGTFALTSVAAGGLMAAAISGGEVDLVARAAAPGLLVMALIYAQGDASGAHFNPVVTLAFALKRLFPWVLVPVYWAAQVLGALVAAGLLLAVLGPVEHVGSTVSVILGTADRYQLIGPNAALAVGGTIILDGLFGGPLSGASMNPARSLGPAIVGGTLDVVWIYLVGPFAGACLAVIGTTLIHGPTPSSAKQREAAQGKPTS
jgi:aquaporin Z